MNKSLSASSSRLSFISKVDGAFAIATMLMVGAFLFASGARDDIISLLIWRPFTALLLVFALAFYGSEAWRRGKPLILFSSAVIGLVLVHLIPLPPDIWTALPGREIVVETYRAAGMDLPWQPLSMAQARTWNALFSLVGPTAMLVVALALSESRHKQLLYILLALGFISGIIGLMQAIGPAYGPLYFYRITNNGTSVGLFANRNHQAAVLATLLPLLAASLSLFKGKPDRLVFHRALTLAFAGLVLPLIFMTGSRTGMVLAFVGAGLAWWVYRTPEATGRVVGIRSEHRQRLVGVGVAAVLFVLVSIIAIRSPALERLMGSDPTDDMRIRAMPIVFEAISRYMPVGSGMGTFVEAYEIGEPDVLISQRYFNHAHNDYLEIVMTGGIPAVVLALWALALGAVAFMALIRGRKVRRGEAAFESQILGRAGFAILAILALASATDYPLRVPSVMLYAAVAAVWCLKAVKILRKPSQ